MTPTRPAAPVLSARWLLTPWARPLLGCAAVLLLTGLAQAQSLTYGPLLGRGLTPDRMIVKWGTAADNDPTSLFVRPRGSARPFLQIDGAAARDHEVWIAGLVPGQSYEYFVRSGAARSAPASFSTCPTQGMPLTVVFYGDSRGNPMNHASVLAQVQRQGPDMVLESGDIAPLGQYSEYLAEFAPVTQELTATTPFMAAPGNHDLLGPLEAGYARVFPMPRERQSDPWRPYYAFTCGNALFLGLDSNSYFDEDQIAFLRAQLQAARAQPAVQHVLVWFHHPPYSPGDHGDNQGVVDLWTRYFQDPRNKISAVFSGHDHIYARMSDGSATPYIVSGGAGADLYGDQGSSQARRVTSAVSLNFVSVRLTGPLLQATAFDDKGQVLDRFSVNRDTVPAAAGVDSLTTDPGGPRAAGCSVAGQGAATACWPLGLLGLGLLHRRRHARSNRRPRRAL